MQSVSQYDTADPTSPGGYNQHFWAFTPVNPRSVYLNGYHVRSGLADLPSFEVRNGSLFALHWSYLENEIWIDSPGDWVAVVDGKAGYAMVERFRVHEGASYPGKASVIFYVNGPSLQLDERGMPKMTSSNPDDTPYYMEAELNSPLVRVAPGESYAMDTDWFPTRTGGNFQTVTDAGVAGKGLAADATSHGIRLSGSFGVFFLGRLVAHLYDPRGAETGAVPLLDVDPSQAVTLQEEVSAAGPVQRVSVHLEDRRGSDRGSLGEVRVNEAPGHR